MNALAQIISRARLVAIFPLSTLDQIFDRDGASNPAGGGTVPAGFVIAHPFSAMPPRAQTVPAR